MALATAKPQSALLPGIPAETFLRQLDTLAAATDFWPLAFVGFVTGSGYFNKFDGSAAGTWFDGVWDIDQKTSFDAAAAAAYVLRVSKPTLIRVQVPGGGLTGANVGAPVYAISGNDYQVQLAAPTTGFVEAIGYIEDVVSATAAVVKPRYKRQTGFGTGALSVLNVPLDLPSIANGTILNAFTPGFAGKIRSMAFVTNKPATTAAKAATLNPKINTTNVTGGVVALTSANATPMGNVVAGTAITAANVFGPTDTLSIVAASVTTFVEGSGSLQLVLEAAANN